jgi:hypothetical protein
MMTEVASIGLKDQSDIFYRGIDFIYDHRRGLGMKGTVVRGLIVGAL